MDVIRENTAQEMTSPEVDRRLLLHACCGPCSLEPSRILQDEGFAPTIFYANSNIWPRAEYERRRDTLCVWAAQEGIPVEEGIYCPEAWACVVAEPTQAWEAEGGAAAGLEHPERCRACYRLRLEEAARYAVEHGYKVLSTTLSVSPYQYNAIIREELEAVAAEHGLEAHFEDFRPYFEAAMKRCRAAGMYCQNYCGCALSLAEAEEGRRRAKEERKAARAAERAAFAEEHAEELAAEAAAKEARKAERRAYDEAQAKKRAILRELRAQAKDTPAE